MRVRGAGVCVRGGGSRALREVCRASPACRASPVSCKPGQVCALTGYPEGEAHLAAQTPLFRGFEPCYPPGVVRAQLGGGRNRRWAQQTTVVLTVCGARAVGWGRWAAATVVLGLRVMCGVARGARAVTPASRSAHQTLGTSMNACTRRWANRV